MAGRMISATLSKFTLLICLGGAQLGCTLWSFQRGIIGRPCRKLKGENGGIGTACTKERTCRKAQKTQASMWGLVDQG